MTTEIEYQQEIIKLKERIDNQEKTIEEFQRGLEKVFGFDKNSIAFFGDLKKQCYYPLCVCKEMDKDCMFDDFKIIKK